MRLSAHVTFRAGLVWAMGLFVTAYAGVLALSDHGVNAVVNLGLGALAVWVPVAVCWLAVSRVGFRRREVLLAGAAVTSFAVGLTYYGLVSQGGGPIPVFSPAAAGFLLFYPLMVAALVATVRHDVPGVVSAIGLDAIVAALGSAAVMAVALSPMMDSALARSLSADTVVILAYPISDLVLVAAVAGVLAVGGRSLGNRSGLLVGGLMLFTAADVVYALRVAAGTYVVGTPLDAAWLAGLALVALWVDGVGRGDPPRMRGQTNQRRGATALVVSSLATVAALCVLVVASRTPLSTLAVALAGVTLLAAAARTQVAFRQLVRMADLRRQEATTDTLTGLPNRRALTADVQARLADPGRCRALLLLDLDKFKEVNDSLGHYVGDLLLIEVGIRLREHLRAGDLLARMGGDEFAIMLDDVGHDQAVAVAVKLRTALAETFTLDDVALHCAVSIGIARFPDDGPDLSTLLRKADIAMYNAKTSGDGVHAYGSDDDTDGAARLRTIEELRAAIASDQLVLHYQPKIELGTGDVHSVEALVRWDHPTRGLLYPDAFLTLVEQAGLMRRMTSVVLTLALDQAAAWHAQGQDLTVAVNLSASSLFDPGLAERIAAMFAARGLPPRVLQLEITEELLMADRQRASAILTQLRADGVQISVDDFGTGYSSLAYLRDLPIDELKLDRSFIFPMADDARAAALVASTIDLAYSLGLRVVAEGVETSVAYNELKRLGCDQAQGFYMCRPIPAAEFDFWLSARRAGAKLNVTG